MNIPPYLQPGSTIGITCPAGFVSHERVAYAIQVLERWGFRVRVGKTVGLGDHYFAGDDAARCADLQVLLDDPSVDAILMGRGGYGVSRIIDQLDFSRFREHPKWICGFSDITVLHSHIHATLGIPTLHSVMCGAFSPETESLDYIQSFRAALSGGPLSYNFTATGPNRPGIAEAIVTGGNLAMLAHLTGSVSAADMAGKILFIEDIGEHLYNIDRMLYNLKRAGKLQHLAGLLVGSFTDLQDTERPFGQTVEAIVNDKVAEYDYPVAFGFPCGHQQENVSLVLGMPQRMTVREDGASLTLLRSS